MDHSKDNRSDDFPAGDDIEIELNGERVWLRIMQCYPCSGGWGRRVFPDCTLDNSREGIVELQGDERVLDHLEHRREKATKSGKANNFDPLRDSGQGRLL